MADGVEKLKKRVGRRSRFRWLAAENIHITLKFLGEVEDRKLDQLSGCCAAIKWSPFVLKLGGSGYFPSVKRPRVFWQGFSAGSNEIRALLSRVEPCAAAIGVAKEQRPYTPHLTLARIKPSKEGNGAAGFRQLQKQADDLLPVGSSFPVTAFSLYQSQLTPAGAVYTRLAAFRVPDKGTSELV